MLLLKLKIISTLAQAAHERTLPDFMETRWSKMRSYRRNPVKEAVVEHAEWMRTQICFWIGIVTILALISLTDPNELSNLHVDHLRSSESTAVMLYMLAFLVSATITFLAFISLIKPSKFTSSDVKEFYNDLTIAVTWMFGQGTEISVLGDYSPEQLKRFAEDVMVSVATMILFEKRAMKQAQREKAPIGKFESTIGQLRDLLDLQYNKFLSLDLAQPNGYEYLFKIAEKRIRSQEGSGQIAIARI